MIASVLEVVVPVGMVAAGVWAGYAGARKWAIPSWFWRFALWHRSSRHDRCLANIARLERELGIGDDPYAEVRAVIGYPPSFYARAMAPDHRGYPALGYCRETERWVAAPCECDLCADPELDESWSANG